MFYAIIVVVIVAAFVLGSLSADQLLRSCCSEKSLKKFKQTAEYRTYRISFCGGSFFTLFLPGTIILAALNYTTPTGTITLAVFGVCGILLLLITWKQARANLERLGLMDGRNGELSKNRKAAHPDVPAIEGEKSRRSKGSRNYGKSRKRR